MCAHEIMYNFHVFEMKVEHDSQHVMGLGLIANWSKCQKHNKNIDWIITILNQNPHNVMIDLELEP